MGTNRRSRRRSAARILNSFSTTKRQKIPLSDTEDICFDLFSAPDDTTPTSPGKSSHTGSTDLNVSCNTTHDSATISISTNMTTNSSTMRSPDTNVLPPLTTAEICSFELMNLLDNAGCPRNTYEQVVSLLKKQENLGFSYSQAHSRAKLLNLLRQKFHCPSIQSSTVKNCDVFSFPFVDMLQDLLDTAGSAIHRISPVGNNSGPFDDELWNTKWMQQTFLCPEHVDFDSKDDIMLPIILYLDKTGTDVLQRYSLEPVLFTIAALKRDSRENRRFWRHLGFIPSSKCIEDSKESLQFYHNCLAYILSGLIAAQQSKPFLRLKDRDGTISTLRAHLPLMIIMGDQLSQDTICCRRKANAGGAGRIHRSCMCSYVTTDDHTAKCQPVPKNVIDNLITFSTRNMEDMEEIVDQEKNIVNKAAAKTMNSRTMKYLRRQKLMFNTILSKPFTTHSVVSAFNDVHFGAWQSGVYDATFDDFMHSCEEGMMENIGGTLFDGLVASEAEKVEMLMIPLLTSLRSSARNTFPRWRLQKGFSRQTLMTMGERVGSIFSVALALHNPEIAKIFHMGHERQRTKYETFPISGEANDFPLYYEQYIHTMTEDNCQKTLTHLYRHGFDVQ